MISTEQIPALRSAGARDRDGHRFGNVGEIYLDDATGEPTWITVNTGMFGTSQSFVPVRDATLEDGDLRVPFPQNLVKNAPPVDAEDRLDAPTEHQLYVHYGLADVRRGDEDSAG
jgi:PRC-barrel domain